MPKVKAKRTSKKAKRPISHRSRRLNSKAAKLKKIRKLRLHRLVAFLVFSAIGALIYTIVVATSAKAVIVTYATDGSTNIVPGTLMIKANDLAELPSGLGTWQIIGCGITASSTWSAPATLSEAAPGPCLTGQDRIFTSYASLKSDIGNGTIKSGQTAIFDPEKWPYTPSYEVSDQAYYDNLAGQLAQDHGIKLIYTPQGPKGTALDADYRAAATYGSVIEIQSQYFQTSPTNFKTQVEHDISVVRSINKTVPILAGLATDPGGVPASVNNMVESYHSVQSLVQGIQLNLAVWRAPTGQGCATTGCVSIGVTFLQDIGI